MLSRRIIEEIMDCNPLGDCRPDVSPVMAMRRLEWVEFGGTAFAQTPKSPLRSFEDVEHDSVAAAARVVGRKLPR